MRLGLIARGLAMGIAEVVPGVSGGTIAFVSGIYDELLRTLAGINPSAMIKHWRRQGFVAAWQAYNLQFLALLATGMLVGVLLFARLMHYGLAVAAPVVWSLFFGLILYSVVDIGRKLPFIPLLPLGLLGLGAGLIVANLVPAPVSPTLLMVAMGGAIAVSAWLLPAVSGSFLLLILGLYDVVLTAIATLQVDIIGALVGGCVLGLLVFPRLLHWVMQRYHHWVVSFLVGFMLGSLPKLWPWRIGNEMFLPANFAEQAGEPAMILPSVLSMALGALIIWGLARIKA